MREQYACLVIIIFKKVGRREKNLILGTDIAFNSICCNSQLLKGGYHELTLHDCSDFVYCGIDWINRPRHSRRDVYSLGDSHRNHPVRCWIIYGTRCIRRL